jgi:multidrug resistance efflux pump
MMKRAAIRYIYITGLLSLFAWIGSWTTGGWVYIRSEGMVVGDPAAIAPEYTVTVKSILVEEGQSVKRGDILARVSSTRIADVSARLTVSAAALTGKLSENATRVQMLNGLLTSAELRERVATEGAAQLGASAEKGNTPTITRTTAVDQMFRGKQDLAALQAEKQALSEQIAMTIEASRQTDMALLDLQNTFDSGNMRSPMDGVVSAIKVGPGAVVREGEPLIELVGETRYVLAFFPIDRLYSLHVGDKVRVDAGGSLVNGSLLGTIAKISSIAGALPREFQKTLAPVERQQLVRINFDQGQQEKLPPYFTKVIVR